LSRLTRRPHRFQLKKEVAKALTGGHPWVFRDKVSGAAQIFADGQWLELVDGENQVVGYGLYQQEGGVAVRVLRLGTKPPDLEYWKKNLQRSIKRRAGLLFETNAYRLLNGESDGFPGIVIDVYDGYAVLQTYTPAVDALGRYMALLAFKELELKAVIWKTPTKRKDRPSNEVRVLCGAMPEGLVKFHEGKINYYADLLSGQKSGTFLDLRGLRRWLSQQPLKQNRILNLFAYTGTAGLAASQAGAREVLNVDSAQASLDFGEKYHGSDTQQWLCADIFGWLNGLSPEERFDGIVVDPPSMASLKTQVPKALATYFRIYKQVVQHIKPHGFIVACCCTSRISPGQFEECVRAALPGFRCVEKLPMEADHRARFEEARYLKVLVFQPISVARAAATEKKRSAVAERDVFDEEFGEEDTFRRARKPETVKEPSEQTDTRRPRPWVKPEGEKTDTRRPRPWGKPEGEKPARPGGSSSRPGGGSARPGSGGDRPGGSGPPRPNSRPKADNWHESGQSGRPSKKFDRPGSGLPKPSKPPGKRKDDRPGSGGRGRK
jgi:23S rRNA (cytosine1962-C5)-methyltransferase